MKKEFKLSKEAVERAARRLESERFAVVCGDLGVTDVTLRSALKRAGLYVYRGNPIEGYKPVQQPSAIHGWDIDFCSRFLSRPLGVGA